jgi:hypothetical protein
VYLLGFIAAVVAGAMVVAVDGGLLESTGPPRLAKDISIPVAA